MSYDIILSDEAHTDIDETLDYIANNLHNPTAAKNLLDKIEETYSELSLNPYMYAVCNDLRLRKEGYRKVVIKNYVMIYRVDDNNGFVYVVRIIYGGRNYVEII
ncbi:MAG: type II toxin-antitoxin system RelE/ParE family toxin [Oscillospiraceae bacterium]|nr:type II toxin-antitoxin system RelE/ParE family toxin [Oscillospiraceae bacterium]